MASIRSLARSFTGGEVTPEFYGRVDDAKFQTGAALLRNFEVYPHGPAANRPGTTYVSEVKDSTKKTRVLPFTYNTTQTFALEMGNLYFRMHTAGATLLTGAVTAYNGGTTYAIGDLASSAGVNYYSIAAGNIGHAPPNGTYWYAMPAGNILEVPSPFLEADLFDIHFVQSADVFTLVHPGYAPRELRRLGAVNWSLIPISFAALLTPPSPTVAGNAKGTNYFYQYVVTSVSADGLQESVASNPAQGVAKTITAVTNANPGVITTSAVHGLVVGNSVLIQNIVGMTQLNNNYYIVKTVPTTTTLTLTDLAGNVIDTTAYGVYSSGGTLYQAGVINDLFASGGANTISWSVVAGVDHYNVYKFSGGVYGYIGQTQGTSFIDNNIAADISQTPPNYDTTLTSTGNYPGAVSYFQQRRIFAGTTNQPQNLWMTREGTESTMSYSLPLRDIDRIAFRIAALDANTIRHVVPLRQLILLTSSGEWQITSINTDAITPASVSVSPQAHVGASNVTPQVINNIMLYVAARGGHIRELSYSWQANGYTSTDLSLRAPHLFDGYDIVDMCYAKAPRPMLWATSSNGTLLGLTYVPEQQITAWHHHDTFTGNGAHQSSFESVCAVAEGIEDAKYVVVQRLVNGATKRYIERFASRAFATQADAFFVDCGMTYNGAPATTITGLTWLVGETVNVLADGCVHHQVVVDNSGNITLDQAASKVQVGLPITADIQTLPLAFEAQAFGQGRAKDVNKVWLRVYNSGTISAGPSFDDLTPMAGRNNEAYGAPPALKTDEFELEIDSAWSQDGHVCLRQTDPLPITLVSMSMEASIGS
jgi:hypothetical protein